MAATLAARLATLILAAACSSQPRIEAEPQSGHYLFAYFKGNGEDGLHLAHSDDGLTWRALKGDSSFFKPTVGKEKLTRDPSIVRGPDGTYHMVWTAGWNEHGFGYAHSTDLVNWTGETYVPVMIMNSPTNPLVPGTPTDANVTITKSVA